MPRRQRYLRPGAIVTPSTTHSHWCPWCGTKTSEANPGRSFECACSEPRRTCGPTCGMLLRTEPREVYLDNRRIRSSLT